MEGHAPAVHPGQLHGVRGPQRVYSTVGREPQCSVRVSSCAVLLTTDNGRATDTENYLI